ncbi:hypothetical protein GS502_10370 [Rhodococcus hoagii]|nr:hypothetical protein [Prescottella equi]
MRYSAIDAARVWVGEQLRYPQRIPRTTTVLDWSAIPWSALQRVSRTSPRQWGDHRLRVIAPAAMVLDPVGAVRE